MNKDILNSVQRTELAEKLRKLMAERLQKERLNLENERKENTLTYVSKSSSDQEGDNEEVLNQEQLQAAILNHPSQKSHQQPPNDLPQHVAQQPQFQPETQPQQSNQPEKPHQQQPQHSQPMQAEATGVQQERINSEMLAKSIEEALKKKSPKQSKEPVYIVIESQSSSQSQNTDKIQLQKPNKPSIQTDAQLLLQQMKEKYPTLTEQQLRNKILHNISSSLDQKKQVKPKKKRPKKPSKYALQTLQLQYRNQYQPSINPYQESDQPQQMINLQSQKQYLNPHSSYLPIHHSIQFPYTKFHIKIVLLKDDEVDMNKINQSINAAKAKPLMLPVPNLVNKLSQPQHAQLKQSFIQSYFSKVKKSQLQDRIQRSIAEGRRQQLQSMKNDRELSARSAKKTSKYLHPFHPAALPTQQKLKNRINSLNYSTFLQRRIKQQNKPIDLGVQNLDEIVHICHKLGLIPQQIYFEYTYFSKPEKMAQFVQLFIDQKLEMWNFNQLKITLADHRRLSQLLVNLFPTKFVICTPHALTKEIHEFLNALYSLPSEIYEKLLQRIDSLSKLPLWATIQIKYPESKVFATVPVQQLPTSAQEPIYVPSIDSKYTNEEKKFIKEYNNARAKPPKAIKRPIQQNNRSRSSSSELSSQLSPVHKPADKKGKGIKPMKRKLKD